VCVPGASLADVNGVLAVLRERSQLHLDLLLTVSAFSFNRGVNLIGKEFKFKNNLSRRFWPL
jgi:hypothetical protein